MNSKVLDFFINQLFTQPLWTDSYKVPNVKSPTLMNALDSPHVMEKEVTANDKDTLGKEHLHLLKYPSHTDVWVDLPKIL